MYQDSSIIWCDLDGTISNCEPRLHYIILNDSRKKKDWKSFYAETLNDEPIHVVMDVVKKMSTHHPIWVATARSEVCRVDTEAWLDKHNIIYDRLLMRAKNDYRPDYIVKKDMLTNEIINRGYKVYLALEDRDTIVTMLRENNVPTFHVAAENLNYSMQNP